MTRPDLTENQLSWARLNIPHFRDMNRKARATQRDTEASKARYAGELEREADRLRGAGHD